MNHARVDTVKKCIVEYEGSRLKYNFSISFYLICNFNPPKKINI